MSTISLWPKTPQPTKGGVSGFFKANVEKDEMRNDWNGEVGYSFVPATDLNVSALARAVSSASGTLKAGAAVTIWSVDTKKPVASTVVDGKATVKGDGYAYANLSAPIILQEGKTYYITQTCTPGMPDMWTNGDSNSAQANSHIASLGNGVFSNKPQQFPDQFEKGPQFAGIVSFAAVVPPNLNPAPATACVCSVPAAPFGQGTGTIQYVETLCAFPLVSDAYALFSCMFGWWHVQCTPVLHMLYVLGRATHALTRNHLPCVCLCISLRYLTTGESIGFPLRCDPFPRETILRDHNPTCDIRTYAGGLSTCHHGWHLLDADQEIPWADQVLSYHFKFRIYFQEYNPDQHISAYGWNTGIEVTRPNTMCRSARPGPLSRTALMRFQAW